MWKNRNNKVHDENSSNNWHRQELIRKAEALYRQKPNLDTLESHILTRPINTILRLPTKKLAQWAASITP